MNGERTFKRRRNPLSRVIRSPNMARLPTIASDVQSKHIDRTRRGQRNIRCPLLCVIVVGVTDNDVREYLLETGEQIDVGSAI
jgi:hypothetical protein